MLLGQFEALAWIMAICSGLMAGIYLAFSVVIMKSLATLTPDKGIEAMNAINRVILKTAFMPLFFGSTVIALLMLATTAWFWGELGAAAVLAAGLIYLLGMFCATAIFNVPLNNSLAEMNGTGEDAVRTWNRYLKHWTRWNTSRTVWSLATFVICLDLLAR